LVADTATRRAPEHLLERARLGEVALRGGGGVHGHASTEAGGDAGIVEREPDRARPRLAGRLGMDRVMGVVDEGGARQRREDPGAAGAREVEALEHQHPRTFREDEPTATGGERRARPDRIVGDVHARVDERAVGHASAHARLAAADQHRVGAPEPDLIRRQR
jgi:hypothetical protein